MKLLKSLISYIHVNNALGRDKIILGEVFADNSSSNANSNRFVAEARMDLLPQSAIAETLWSQAYGVIASANIIIAADVIIIIQNQTR